MVGLATEAQVVRSCQKDALSSEYLKQLLNDVAQTFLAPGTWIQWQQNLDLLAQLGYLGLTTLAGLQTLGEEYVGIIQVNQTRKAIPSRWMRAVMIVLQVYIPHIINKLLKSLESRLGQTNSFPMLSETVKATLRRYVPIAKHAVTMIHRCHLVVFYLRGVFYHIAKRVTGIRYASVHNNTRVNASAHNYQLLGWLTLLPLGVNLSQQICRAMKGQETSPVQPQSIDRLPSISIVPESMKCALCLERRSQTTTPPCGHLFCWDCIMQWGATKPQCPICRQAFTLSRLIYLQNYDPT